MINTLAPAMPARKMPEFIIFAYENANQGDSEAVMVIDDWSKVLIEAFTASDIAEAKSIVLQLGRRHPDSNYMVLSPQVFLILFGSLILSDDGHLLKDDLFPMSKPRNAQVEATQLCATLSLLQERDALELRVDESASRIDAIATLVKRFHDEAKSTSFNVLPDVVETYFGALMALMGIEEDEQ